MKKLFKFISAVFIILAFASCEKRQDWTCVCQYPVPEGIEFAPWMLVSTTVIMDSKEKDAVTECDWKDSALLGYTWNCELVE